MFTDAISLQTSTWGMLFPRYHRDTVVARSANNGDDGESQGEDSAPAITQVNCAYAFPGYGEQGEHYLRLYYIGRGSQSISQEVAQQEHWSGWIRCPQGNYWQPKRGRRLRDMTKGDSDFVLSDNCSIIRKINLEAHDRTLAPKANSTSSQ